MASPLAYDVRFEREDVSDGGGHERVVIQFPVRVVPGTDKTGTPGHKTALPGSTEQIMERR